MSPPPAPFDFRIYAMHAVFWLTFAAGDLVARSRSRRLSDGPVPDPVASGDAPLHAPRAGLLVAVHGVGFGLMYAGIGIAIGAQTPAAPPLQRGLGALVIFAGGLLGGWARLAFASWRFRAQIDPGHRLATGGPFRWIRHPIYAALDLMALGSALWVPTPLTWLGVIAMIAGGELRARAEEPLLERAFGDAFREYRQRTSRFLPGIY